MARYMGLAALKEDAISVGSTAAGIVVGAGVAKVVVNKLSEALLNTDEKTKADSPYIFPGANYVAALVPAAVGIAIQTYGASKLSGAAKDATSGVAAGMVAYSIGKIVANLVKGTPNEATVGGYLALGAMADGVYDYSLSGNNDGVYDYSLGAYNSAEWGPGGVSAYMMNGFGDAPTTTELAGMPVDIQQLNGLGAAPVSVSTYAPLNTALTA